MDRIGASNYLRSGRVDDRDAKADIDAHAFEDRAANVDVAKRATDHNELVG